MLVCEGGFGKIDNPLVHMVSTCMHVDEIATGWKPLCCMGGCCAGGRCGPMGVAETLEVVEVVEDLG